MNPKLRLLLRTGAGLLALCTIGCSSGGPAPKAAEPCKLQVLTSSIIASPHINPTESGEPRPVQVRLYQLKSDTSLLNSSFEEVWKDDKKALGEDLVKVEQFPVYPDSRTTVNMERNPEAQFLVAAGLFREPKGRSWYTSLELPPPPGAGSCAAKCKKGECEGKDGPNPQYYFWIDGSTLVEGSDHADDYPKGRVHDAGDLKPVAVEGACAPASPDPTWAAHPAKDQARSSL